MDAFLFQHVTIVSPHEMHEGDVLVVDDKIQAVGIGFKKPTGTHVIDGTGKFLLPGVIDPHVHFRVPGGEHKEDWNTGSRAAVSGGVTTVFDMPNTNPPTTTIDLLNEKRALVRGNSFVNYGFFFGATDENSADQKAVDHVSGIKLFFANSTGNLGIHKEDSFDHIFAQAGASGRLIAVHAEDAACLLEHEKLYGDDDVPSIHSMIRPAACAAIALKNALHFAKKFSTRVHVCHVTSAEELVVLRKFKSVQTSAEVTPHHLFLDETAYAFQQNFVKVNPPLRTKKDREALWTALKNGLIDIVASDHAPHTKGEKERSYKEAPSGVPGVETLLPLLLNEVNHGRLTLERLVAVTSANAARIFGLSSKGKIAPGMDADLVLVDMEMTREIWNETVQTKCGWNPFHGRKVMGWPVLTMVNGRIVYEDGMIQNGPVGREVYE